MHVFTFVTRVIVTLLVARAIAAPLAALRLNTDDATFHSILVVRRVYAWPQQRLERFSPSSKLLELFQGKNKPVSEDAGLLWESRPLRTTFLSSIIASHASGASGDRAASRSTERLRC